MFNARAAAGLEAGQHLTVDGALGLRLAASATKRTWTYRFKSPVDGRMRQVRLGHWPAMSPAAALVAWERLRQQRSAGVDPVVQRRADRAASAVLSSRAGFTVRALCDEYLGAYRNTVADKSFVDLSRLFARNLDALAALPAASLTRAQAFDLLQQMRDRPVVARRLRQGLGAAWDHALDAGRLPPDAPNWWRLVLRGKLPSRGKAGAGVVKRVLSDDEVGELIRWLPNFSRDVDDMLTLYLWTCCRGAEIVAMERAEITHEADGMWWTVPRAKLKMRRNPLTVDLRVPLVGRACALVMRRMDAHSGRWVFPSRAGGHTAQKVLGTSVWNRMPYCETRPEQTRARLPVANWAPHDLRRTGRTMLAAMGCPLEVAEAILGHLAPGVQGVYDRHGYTAERRVWLTRLAERLEVLAAG